MMWFDELERSVMDVGDEDAYNWVMLVLYVLSVALIGLGVM
jgi:hypothetical protein